MLLMLFSWMEHIVFTVFVLAVVQIWMREGGSGVAKRLLQGLRSIPALNSLILTVLSSEVKTFTKQIKNDGREGNRKPPRVVLPEKGIAHDELMKEMEVLKASDSNPEDGRMFAYVYTGNDDNFALQRKAYDMFCEKTGLTVDHDKLVQAFHHAFMHENALSPMIFPSLRRFENEVISMTASMLHGDEEVVGSLTSGGTESILMAMKAYRDRARKLFPHISNPEMVAPVTIHPAHEKAAYYFGFTIRHVAVNEHFQPDLTAFEQAITPSTIALLTSAPQYCQGIVDPIEDIAKIALRRSLPLHVDACFGGFMLPWVEKLGYSMPKFDFRVPGVTSVTADIHKYGFGAKGASVVLYKNEEFRKFQIFAYSQWPGGLFGSPSMAGTRPGGNIAAAWVALKAMGQDGYIKVAKQLMETTNSLKEGINNIQGVRILGEPNMTAFAIGSDDPSVSILAVADVLEERGWKPERQQYPDSLHCTIMPHHVKVASQLVQDLTEAVAIVKDNKALSKKGTAAMYGMVASIPDKSIVDDFIVEFFSEVYKA